MLIRSEDFGDLKKYKKIWFTCEQCDIGVLQLYKTYLNQKDGKFCRSCRNKHSLSKVKDKISKRMKEQWKNPDYRKKLSKSLSEGCLRGWEKDNGTRRKSVSENTSKGLKRKWKDSNFKNSMIEIQKEIWKNPELRKQISEKNKENWRAGVYENKKSSGGYNIHTYEYIKSEIEAKNYKLLSLKYISAFNKISIECPEKHIYKVRYNDFQQGHRCPYCSKSKQFSKDEKEILNYIKSLNIDIIENDRNLITPYELDIIIPSKKIAIEYCGLYWHSELKGKNKSYHLNKTDLCNKLGYQLITIFEDEWLNKQEIVKSRLKHILNKSKNKIYGRKCIIKEIEPGEAKRFIDKYHIQGYTGCSVKLGAFYNNKLVSVMTFGKPSLSKGRKYKNYKIWELSRFCLSQPIIGIAGKFLKYFQRNYEYDEIFTYADRRWSTGRLYEKIGFEKMGNTKLNYWYFNSNKRIHRFNFRKNILDKKLEKFDVNKTEWQNMKENGWNRIWDCGNILYKI